MKNCIVKMVVKNRNRTNPQDLLRSQATEEMLSAQTPKQSRSFEEKDGMGTQLNVLLGSFEKLLKEVNKLNKAHEIEPRDRRIVFQLPVLKASKEGGVDEQQLKLWITNLCTEVFSAAFHYFEQGKMSYDQTKIYCSENLICNIMRLEETYHLNSHQMKMIDEHINDGVTSYLLTKFPMTETMVVNKALEGEVKEIDNIEALENDIFYYSQDSYGFEYRENGNYNDLIMRLVNDLMRRTDEKDMKAKISGATKVPTFYEQFYEFMQASFENLESREWMDGQAPTVKDELAKRTDEEKYRARVKGYTSYAIGRKISENVSQFSESEISSMHMTIKNPAILRILTKWCEELWTKFEKKNYFLDRTENVKCQRGGNVNTYFAWMKQIVNDMVEEEKSEIERFLEQIFANNYDQQAIHCFRSLKSNSFSHVEKFEKAAGIFTVNIVNNLHSYIILYLNRLIHGLLKVSKRVYDRELIGRARWTSPPNLISFKIGDLMRCKIASQEREILKLFKHLSKWSESNPKEFKIIRIKNRLKEGTNDILMNFRFKDVFICEAQLAVNSDHSNFIKCSNKYNHFIYEVKRSIFGPITELCSIWRSLDGRFKIYQKMAGGKSNQNKGGVELKTLCELQNRSHIMLPYNQPFVCSSCQLTYSHSNYIWPHNRCDHCSFTQCCRCRINSEHEGSLKEKLFKGSDLKKFCSRAGGKEDIPKYGICFMIESKQLSMQKFAKFNIKGKVGLYFRSPHNEINLITDLNTKKEVDAFREKYITFRFPIAEGEKIVNIAQKQAKNDFLLPKLVKSIYKKQKQFISLIGQEIDDATIEQTLAGSPANRNLIRCLELPDNSITNIDFICNSFPNLTKLVLSRNKISKIDSVCKLFNLQQLNIRDNDIEELPLSLFDRFKLENLNIRNNKIKSIPEEISKLTNLNKLELNQLGLKELPKSMCKMQKLQYLDASKNDLGEVPEQLRHLTRLSHLGLSNNGIKVLPEWIGELVELKDIQLNKNKLDAIPESLANLTNLIQLELENNKFEKLDFKCPQSVTVLLLNDNSIHEIGENFFKNCKNLVKLEIHKNKIERLPRDFGILCPNMKSLGLNNNCLSKLPDILEVFLPSIELIELSSNQFKLFPAKALKNCFGLVELHMANNPDFDDEIPTGFLDKNTKIEKFDFSKTKLSKLPQNITLASTLKRLNFSETAIPSGNLQVLAGLQYVEELILSKMKLRVLPQSLKKQHALHVLNLEDNEISEIDDDFFEKLTHLRNINLANNSIKAIPSSFKNCRRIKFINFDHNNLTEFPAAIFDLTRIQKIILSNNQIQKLVSGVHIPSSVTHFDLRQNKISFVSPPFFKGADGLTDLNLSGNQLKSCPQGIRECSNLTKTDFTGNQIEVAADDVVRQTFINFVTLEQNEFDVPADRNSLMNTFIQ